VARATDTSQPPPPTAGREMRPTHWRRGLLLTVLTVGALLGVARAALPSAVLWYVNRTINQDPLYDGLVEDVDIHLWRGAYSIHEVRLNKVTGNVPVPFFEAQRVDLAIQWDALFQGKVVGRIRFDRPELNFVDGPDESQSQTGAGAPWLDMIRDLFPFRINRATIRDGTIRFHAFHKDPPVELYLSDVQAAIDNLTNIHDDIAPLVATVRAEALAMDHAKVEYVMKLDPAAYRPTVELAVRLRGLDVTKTNDLARAYGAFDFEGGWMDLVVELNILQGQIQGYVKPMFRDLKVLSLTEDVKDENALFLFWEALVGALAEVFENQPRDQFATKIPLRGDVGATRWSLLELVGNVLRNAFIRAYLPRLEGAAPDVEGLEFEPASILEPSELGP
jgi:hypothetical protein